ncbi:HAMP domain-containing sensor histidine kinase [Methanolobus sp.]|uniref:sensor histidine kinase n=1 Tax=Methanolobus sp. TaxID=1874737 RepID=UPI0025D68C22|nr:HAMP domain-containing sensor histidine kinase [Methanolobus sp.]
MHIICERRNIESTFPKGRAIGVTLSTILIISLFSLIVNPVFAEPHIPTGPSWENSLEGSYLESEQPISRNISTAGLYTWESPMWLKLSVGIGGSLLLLMIILSFVLRDKIDEKTMELNSKNRQLEIEIRERKIAEDKLKNYSSQLKSSNELKDLFTDILRHDLINPATVIKGYVEYLIEYENDTKKITALKTIERNNLKLIQMIENAANLAKLENVEELEFEEMDLRAIIEEVVEGLQPKADDKEMHIQFVPGGNYPAQVNRIIEEVFSNLIANSIKYSPPSSVICIGVCALNDKYWKISVVDNGSGIADDDKTHIFDRFKRAEKTNIKGTGLGLAIAKRIIELHDGQIGVEDNPSGKGSVFWVTLHR